ncbi:MAG: hypothetical protein IPN53_25150 [Comamonadaceae bacterium]|nr:hypothetical protein [Comamonadaceae bacterium]
MAVAYLEHRHCVMPPAYGALRWHSALRHPTGYTGPCLVALISDTHSNKPLSLHRTWITATGKADVSPPRLLLANHAIKNGVIKLWPDEDVGHTLGIAEGIETALSMAHAVQPVWACIDAGHLGALSGDLYRSFSEWKSAQGEHAPSNKAFSQRLERMFSKKTTKHGKAFQGLILKAYSTGGSYAEQSRGE